MARGKRKGDPIAEMQGRRLRLAREAKSRRFGREFRQEDVAEEVGQGLTLAAYGSYERGRHRIPEEWVEPIAHALDVSPYYILGMEEPRPYKERVRLIADLANQIESEEILDFLVGVISDQLKLDQSLRGRSAQASGAMSAPPSQ